MPVTIRPATATDLPYILATWVRAYRDVGPLGRMRWRDYKPLMRRRMAAILDHEATQALVAAENDAVYGWIVYSTTEPLVVHFVYVRAGTDTAPIRGQGLGRALASAAGIDADTALLHTVDTGRGNARRLVSALESKVAAAGHLPIEEFLA